MHHPYHTHIVWTGNLGKGTVSYADYERSHTIEFPGKLTMEASSDKPFRGDGSKPNPEDLLLASLSSCHMLWYLHLCADAGIIVMEYSDKANGVMEVVSGAGKFIEVTLYPNVVITDPSRIDDALQLHHRAHQSCFIANSVNFPVKHDPIITAINNT
jgi:organic hydroperoxide reductase OsmC/OhrA